MSMTLLNKQTNKQKPYNSLSAVLRILLCLDPGCGVCSDHCTKPVSNPGGSYVILSAQEKPSAGRAEWTCSRLGTQSFFTGFRNCRNPLP